MSHDPALVAKVAEAICEWAEFGDRRDWRDYETPARAVLDALDVPGRERRAKAEGIREAVARVRDVYDMQCPVEPGDHYVHKWARLAHRWWEKVLGGQLERLTRRAAELDPDWNAAEIDPEIDPEEGDHE